MATEEQAVRRPSKFFGLTRFMPGSMDPVRKTAPFAANAISRGMRSSEFRLQADRVNAGLQTQAGGPLFAWPPGHRGLNRA